MSTAVAPDQKAGAFAITTRTDGSRSSSGGSNSGGLVESGYYLAKSIAAMSPENGPLGIPPPPTAALPVLPGSVARIDHHHHHHHDSAAAVGIKTEDVTGVGHSDGSGSLSPVLPLPPPCEAQGGIQAQQQQCLPPMKTDDFPSTDGPENQENKRGIGQMIGQHEHTLTEEPGAKRLKAGEGESLPIGEAPTTTTAPGGKSEDDGPAPVLPSKEGTSIFSDNDVLSGRGGGTNVHPGNRNFRDLINMHRRAYLKARKNDKPAISRAIVRSIRESNGRFLKKDEKTGLWFEIGDDAAREKTSQALRQRAPEMRKLLFDTEREEARAAAEEHLRQQRMLMGMGPGPEGGMNGMQMPPVPPGMNPGGMPMPPVPPNGVGAGGGPGAGANPMFPNPAFYAMANKQNGMNMPNMQQGNEGYPPMFPAAILGGGMNRFTPNAS